MNDSIIKNLPNSTYRVQFSSKFTFEMAERLIGYFKSIGISHLYGSPIMNSRTDSTHGYDVISHDKFNPLIGSDEHFYNLSDRLKKHNMGFIFDLVPNHMGISKENKWWWDILENGQASQYSSFFDIDWYPPKQELTEKVLVPILGDHYGNVLTNGELKFRYDTVLGKIVLNYYEHEFPINPASYPMILEHKIDLLEGILEASNDDFQEFASISAQFKNLSKYNTADRTREKEIAYRRLSNLTKKNGIINDFIKENLLDFQVTEKEDNFCCTRLHLLLEKQNYRLAYWRVSSDEINYRRFFDVNDLAALSMENPQVFKATHEYIFKLIADKRIDGIRIDHVDGLSDPMKYFMSLQKKVGGILNINNEYDSSHLLNSSQLPFYIIVEKILAPIEKLPKNWAIHGTVGYEFLNALTNLFVESKNEKKITRIYHKFINNKIDYESLVIKCKKLIMKTALTGELTILANVLDKISEHNYITRDYTFNNLRESLIEIIAGFPVYRTYISENHLDTKCVDYCKWAIGAARKRAKSSDHSIFDFIENLMFHKFTDKKNIKIYNKMLSFTTKFQQYTAPLMAKGLEDTAFYRYNRLISLNEVGFNPQRFGISINEFHNQNQTRLAETPYSLLTTSTHDTKKSEDIRARINVLSEIPEIWDNAIRKFSQLNKKKKIKVNEELYPDKNDEYMFYQILLGIWHKSSPNEQDIVQLTSRLTEYMVKAAREAKFNTSWINVNQQYEDALCSFINKVMSSYDKHPFWKEFFNLYNKVLPAGYVNSLSQLTIKLTTPGIPDIYQGCELWNFTLVDPDNRKTANYENLTNIFYSKIKPLLENKKIITEKMFLPFENGEIKFYTQSKIMAMRNEYTDLFIKGEYIPIGIIGEKSHNVIAYARIHNEKVMIVVIPRFISHSTISSYNLCCDELFWKNSQLNIPQQISNQNFINILTNEEISISDTKISSLLKNFPVGVFLSID